MHDQDSQTTAATQKERWWIWNAWVARNDELHFVYGCAARYSRLASDSDRSIDLADTGKLLIRERIVDEDSFDCLCRNLELGAIMLADVNGQPFPAVSVSAHRRVIQSCLGYTATRAKLFYTLPDIATLLGGSDAAFECLLLVLEQELNLSFKGSYAARCGNFEIFDFPGWLNTPQPFLAEVTRDRSKPLLPSESIILRRTPDFANDRHVAHVIGRAAGDVVVDRLVDLPVGETRVSVPVAESLDNITFRLFDSAAGALLHAEEFSFFNRVSFVLGALGGQMTLNDDLSAKARSKNVALGDKASTVGSVSPQRGSVGMPSAGSWRKFADDMHDHVAALLPKPSEDRWFPRGVEGEIDAIAHFNRLLNGGHVSAGILVDPWFGAEALRRFALRLGSSDLPLTIITSWTTTDPDTGRMFGAGSAPTAALEAALDQLKPFLNLRLSVINLADGRDQAFHDRYLLLRPHEGPTKIFLLSNSLSKIAAKWPFAMSLLAPDVSRQVRPYIEGLENGFDTARNRSLDVTLRWPHA